MTPVFRLARRRALSLGIGRLLWLALALLLPFSVAPAGAAARTIVLDAGHGGFDRGGIPGQRVAEKPVTLDVALRVGKKLRASGYRVIFTRSTDVFVPLSTRVAIANSYRDAQFVSIHFNSATRAGANGIETYYYRNDSARLAANIHRQVVSNTVTENRGIRRRGFYVIRRTSIPSVLVECGFLTNPSESRLALQTSYRDRLADGIVAGILGRSASRTRPVVAGLTHLRSPLGDGRNDFVSVPSERRSISHHRSRSSKKSSSRSKSKKKSTSSTKKSTKKKSSDH